MKIPMYNQEGKKAEEIDLPSKIFELEQNLDLVYQVANSQAANKRQVIAHTKHRGEVSGGGKKPWAQKHTGRARHGSIRSPLWRKGGVAFGPRNTRVFKEKINTKMRRKSLFILLSEKVRSNTLIVLDNLIVEKPKTKILESILAKLPFEKGSVLLVLPQADKNIILAAGNIPFVKVVGAKNLNTLDLLSSKFIIMPKESMKVIEETFKI